MAPCCTRQGIMAMRPKYLAYSIRHEFTQLEQFSEHFSFSYCFDFIDQLLILLIIDYSGLFPPRAAARLH